MTEHRTAFVTGATGAVGPALVSRLLDEGYRVRALVRPGREPRLPAGVEPVTGYLDDDAAIAEGVAGADVVFHLAALLHVNAPGPELALRYLDVNVRGTERLLEAARGAGVARFVFFSTINAYGPSDGGAPWRESDPVRPLTPYARTKAEAEQRVLAEPGGVVLRLAAVYGPGMRGNYRTLAVLLARGLPVLPGTGSNRRTLVHRDDVASAALLAAEHPAATGNVFNVTDGDIHAFDEIVRAVQRAAGRRPGVRYLPAAPLLALARVARVSHLVERVTEDVAVSGERIQHALGFVPRVPLDAGWRDVLRSFGREGGRA